MSGPRTRSVVARFSRCTMEKSNRQSVNQPQVGCHPFSVQVDCQSNPIPTGSRACAQTVRPRGHQSRAPRYDELLPASRYAYPGRFTRITLSIARSLKWHGAPGETLSKGSSWIMRKINKLVPNTVGLKRKPPRPHDPDGVFQYRGGRPHEHHCVVESHLLDRQSFDIQQRQFCVMCVRASGDTGRPDKRPRWIDQDAAIFPSCEDQLGGSSNTSPPTSGARKRRRRTSTRRLLTIQCSRSACSSNGPASSSGSMATSW